MEMHVLTPGVFLQKLPSIFDDEDKFGKDSKLNMYHPLQLYVGEAPQTQNGL
jgi:hypothetical protein